jgi:hypothetical protein
VRDVTSTPVTVSRAAPSLPVASDGRCPVSARRTVAAAYAPALGRGPVYPVGFAAGGVLRLVSARQFASRQWAGAKVLWIRKPGTRGEIVITGRRLDRPGVVRFDQGDVPADHLTLRDPGDRTGWVDHPSDTRVRTPGCYAYTVQGPGIREIVVFRAAR